MKAFLLFRDRDFDPEQRLPPNANDLVQDLELATLLDTMADGDPFVREVAGQTLLASLTGVDDIRYRQAVLRDCLRQPAVVRELYSTAVEAIERERKAYRYFRSPDGILYSSAQVLEQLMTSLASLRVISDTSAELFESEGFSRFFEMIATDLDDEYFRTVEDHLQRLRFRQGVLVSAGLGVGNAGVDYVLRRPHDNRQTLLQRVFRAETDSYSLQIDDHDESGTQALSELRERGINLVANAIAQSTDHIIGFFRLLRAELAFYVGCLNLHERLSAKAEPLCFPVPAEPRSSLLSATDLYDPSLSLTLRERAIGNDLAADGKSLVVITGANQGGKSTLLRAVGVAQLMMQAGMFTPASSLHASVCAGLFTHYPREEDATMSSGKLAEELARMSALAEHLRPHALLLSNESFASTNEREGSDLAAEILRAVLESGIRVFFVTHLYHLAHTFHSHPPAPTLFLRAERLPDGNRPYKLVEAPPRPTSHGEDLYQKVFGPA